jgi:hypothetical protein
VLSSTHCGRPATVGLGCGWWGCRRQLWLLTVRCPWRRLPPHRRHPRQRLPWLLTVLCPWRRLPPHRRHPRQCTWRRCRCRRPKDQRSFYCRGATRWACGICSTSWCLPARSQVRPPAAHCSHRSSTPTRSPWLGLTIAGGGGSLRFPPRDPENVLAALAVLSRSEIPGKSSGFAVDS